MKVLLKRFIYIIGGLTGILTALYTGLSVYYVDSFSYGTWINGIYCTGMSISEANEKLLADKQAALKLTLPEGEEATFPLTDIGYCEDYTDALLKIRQKQDPWRWYENLFLPKGGYLAIPKRTLSEEKFYEAFEKLPFVVDRKPEDAYRVFLQKTKEGYILVNERERVPNYEACSELIRQAVLQGDAECDLTQEACFHALSLSETMQETIRIWKMVEAFQDCGIVYRFGEDLEAVDGSVVCDWLIPAGENTFLLDEDGELLFDREKLEAYVDMLADRYDTVDREREFTTTSGRHILLKSGTYGNRINRKAEKRYLYEAFTEKRRETHEPAYLQKAMTQGYNDIGNTYIEVDMGAQKLFYYQEGTLVLETPVVTGDMSRKRSTPEGVYYVYAKQRNRTLRGPGYAARVNYWMPVNRGIGIHDAGWRKEFGGEIYETQGSHGCINVPPDCMPALYETAEVGTPVLLFY